ncbi:DNA repair protein RadC [Sedimentibacter sp. zth1]|uniref:JAB domain-containing protein n=1 Tax=Sedimentibacter sp. zth1 TaxID=2816908 RepID=UPI001A928532|nr:JAB domain-containing protein [Sedimentibacter sp. zth1]QSX05450.1 DNA repair protein RadC [Sedimentibacter sp. zth1]
MMEITKYRIELVRENSKLYDIANDKATTPESVYEIIKDRFNISSLAEEIFGILCLDTKNNIVGTFQVSHGNLDGCTVHPREIFKRAMLVNSASIILFHNHPSGEPEPSKEDKNVTNRLIEAGKILGIRILDHIIACDSYFLSFKEHGYC